MHHPASPHHVSTQQSQTPSALLAQKPTWIIIISIIVGILLIGLVIIGLFAFVVVHSLSSARDVARQAEFKSLAESVVPVVVSECDKIKSGTPKIILPGILQWKTPPVCANGRFGDAVVISGECKATITSTGVRDVVVGDCSGDNNTSQSVVTPPKTPRTPNTVMEDSASIDDAVTGSNHIVTHSGESREQPLESQEERYIKDRRVFDELYDPETGIVGNVKAFQNAIKAGDMPVAEQQLMWTIEKIQRAEEKVNTRVIPTSLMSEQSAQVGELMQLEAGFAKILLGVRKNDQKMIEEGKRIVAGINFE